MKKILALVLALCMVLACVACSDSGTSAAEATEAPAAETEAATEEAATSDVTYKVGVCQLVQHEALDAATQGFVDVLTEKLGDSVVIDVQNAQGDSNTCATIANSFVSEGDDLIMANATAALQAAQAATNEIPILGTSITTYGVALGLDDFDTATGINISGTSDCAPLDEQAEMLAEWFPDAKKVGMVYCSAEPNSQYQIDMVSAKLEELGYEPVMYTFSDSNDIATVVTNAVADVDVIYVPTDNTVASNTDIINNICLPAGIPVVCGEEGICAGCGVCTLSISYYDLGCTTGEMAYEILVNGADPATMDIQYAPATKKYNAEICEQLGLTVPEGYEAIE